MRQSKEKKSKGAKNKEKEYYSVDFYNTAPSPLPIPSSPLRKINVFAVLWSLLIWRAENLMPP